MVSSVCVVLFILVYLTFFCNLLFKMLVVSLFFEIKGNLMLLCFIYVMWNFCLKGLFKSLFCSYPNLGHRLSRLMRWRERISIR